MQQRYPIPANRVSLSQDMRQEMLDAMAKPLLHGKLTQSETVAHFEQTFAARHTRNKFDLPPLALAVSSGTAALELIFRSLLKPGQGVIVPSNTYFATVAAIHAAGGIPLFADICPYYGTLTAETVVASLNRWQGLVKAVCYVHIGGICAHHAADIKKLCLDANIDLVEDVAHSPFTSFDGVAAGAFGAAAAFSFHATKILTTGGEGGMVLTPRIDIAANVELLRNHGKMPDGDPYLHLTWAGNYRMTSIQAAIGSVMLRHIDAVIAEREKIASLYYQHLAKIDWLETRPPLLQAEGSNWYKLICKLPYTIKRHRLKEELKRSYSVGLPGEVFPRPCHVQPVVMRDTSIPQVELPVTLDFCEQHICLPLYAEMSPEEVACVCAALDRVKEAL